MYNQTNFELGICRSLALCDYSAKLKEQRFKKAGMDLITRKDFSADVLIALLYKALGEEELNKRISLILTDGKNANLLQDLKQK